ncbi:MAG: PLP-dependent aminotransferase family protein [Rubrivivax sp.]|nr:PLP-dependent aminotransferase family protein [Rubrivivax sp.]
MAVTPFPPSAAGTGSAAQRAFVPHLPALDAFPLRLWAGIAARRARALDAADLADGDARGRAELRQAIVDYLGQARGVSCHADQVLVLASVQQALDLVARMLLDAGDRAWVEDPGYAGTTWLLRAAGLRLHAVPVDDEGLDVAAARRRCPAARLACVTPAHQAPLGMALSLPRRLALLEWARRSGAWIFEDDYDSEYRYAGRPLPALQSLDPAGPVLYAGCFSKTLFPALRVAYLVVPPALVPVFAAARSLTSRYPPVLDQLVLAEFMAGGHYARHLRRMRQLYAERRAALVAGLAGHAAGVLEVIASPTGLNVAAWLPRGADEARVVHAAARAGLVVQGLAGSFASAAARRPGLLLGFASLSLPLIGRSVRRLGAVLREEGLEEGHCTMRAG